MARIVGECACSRGMVWDDYEMQCETQFFGSMFMIAAILIVLLILLCCCVGGVFFFMRKIF